MLILFNCRMKKDELKKRIKIQGEEVQKRENVFCSMHLLYMLSYVIYMYVT